MKSSQVVDSKEVLTKVSELFEKTNKTLQQFTDLQKNVYLKLGMLLEGTKAAAEFMSNGVSHPGYIDNLNAKLEGLKNIGVNIKASEKDLIARVDTLKNELKEIQLVGENDKDAARINTIVHEISKTIKLLDETNVKMSADITKTAEPFRNLIRKVNELKTSHTLFAKSGV